MGAPTSIRPHSHTLAANRSGAWQPSAGGGAKGWSPASAEKRGASAGKGAKSSGPEPPIAAAGVGGAMKRPGTPQPAAGALQIKKSALAASGAAPSASSAIAGGQAGVILNVTSPKGASDNVVVRTLVGTYKDLGENHGKRYYKKLERVADFADLSVYLYYWDDRDGADFSGWWFGDQVGGTQVFALVKAASASPPRIGWKVPWDAPRAEPGILLVDPMPPVSARMSTKDATATQPGVKAVPTAVSSSAGLNKPVLRTPTSKAITVSSSSQEGVVGFCQEVEQALASAREAIQVAKGTGGAPAAESMQELEAQKEILGELNTKLNTELAAARSRGPPTSTTVSELSKLTSKVRTLQASITFELTKARKSGELQQAKIDAAAKVQAAALKAKEAIAKAAKSTEEVLPNVTVAVSEAEDAVESASIMASQLESETLAEDGGDIDAALAEVEKLSTAASSKIINAGRAVNSGLQTIKRVTPQTEDTGAKIAKLNELRKTMEALQAKLSALKKVRADLVTRARSRKVVKDFHDKVTDLEVEAENVRNSLMSIESPDAGSALGKAETSITTKMMPNVVSLERQLDQKLRDPAAMSLKADLEPIMARVKACGTTLDSLVENIRGQREAAKWSQTMGLVIEKVKKAEDHLESSEAAEEPFREGAPSLNEEDASKAVKAAEEMNSRAEKSINHAKGFTKQKLVDAKRLPEDLSARAFEDLNNIMDRLEAMLKKLLATAKETFERKYSSLMPDVLNKLVAAEAQVDELKAVVKPLSSPEGLSDEDLKEAGERAIMADKEASKTVGEARKALDLKTKELKGKSAAAMTQLLARVQAASTELAKLSKMSGSVEKVLKLRRGIADEEAQIGAAERDADRVELLATASNDTISGEAALELETIAAERMKLLNESIMNLDALAKAAPAGTKDTFAKLRERNKAAQKRIEDIKIATKGKREEALCRAYVDEIVKKGDECEELMRIASDAEMPFLSGLEVLPDLESREALSNCDKAIADLNKALTQTKTYAAAKSIEIKRTKTENTALYIEELTKQQERLRLVGEQLTTFRKDVTRHKRNASLHSLSDQMSAAEDLVGTAREAVRPCEEEDQGEITQEDAGKMCEKVSEVTASAQVKLEEIAKMVMSLSKDQNKEDGSADIISAVRKRLEKTKSELAKMTKVASEYEQKFVSKKLLEEANAKMEEAQRELANVTEACAPLLVESGEKFLIAASIQNLVDALRQYITNEGKDLDALFLMVSGGNAEIISKEAFKTYLAALPEKIHREDVGFSEARQDEMFVYFAQPDGITRGSFKEMFCKSYKVLKPITLTNEFEVTAGKPLTKLEIGDVLEAVGDAKKDPSSGMIRMQCKQDSKNLVGWVTSQGNQGSIYLEPISPFTKFAQEIDQKVEAASKIALATVTWLKARCADLASIGDGPIKVAREEMAKMKPKCIETQSEVEKLKRRLVIAKRDYATKEQDEKSAFVSIKDQRDVDAALKPVRKIVDEAKALLEKLEEAAQPLSAPDTAVRSPFSTQNECEKLAAELKALTTHANSSLKETGAVELFSKASKGPRLDGKRELDAMKKELDGMDARRLKVAKAVAVACKGATEAARSKFAKVLRQEMHKRKLSPEAFFEELASPSGSVSDADLCKLVTGLDDSASFESELVKVAVQKLHVGGSVKKRLFVESLQVYYQVVKEIAITGAFAIGQGKTVRKVEVSEVLEMLEGPTLADELGVQRLRGRAMKDGVVGWVTISGNKGTPFLKETPKPYYASKREIAFDDDIEGTQTIRKLHPEEIFELLEGPRAPELKFQNVLHAAVKAIKDGAQGSLTVRDAFGNVFAEASDKHYIVVTTTGITDAMDMSVCKVIRKLAIGEVFEALDEPVEEAEKGIKRVHARALKDGIEGWIAISGTTSKTVYAKPSTKHFVVRSEVRLENQEAAKGATIARPLAVGELLEVQSGPKEEKVEPLFRVKGRLLGENNSTTNVGWVSFAEVRLCQPRYTCKKAASLRESPSSEALVIRELGACEVLEPLESPVPGKDDGEVWLQVRVPKDNSMGFVRMQDKSAVFLTAM